MKTRASPVRSRMNSLTLPSSSARNSSTASRCPWRKSCPADTATKLFAPPKPLFLFPPFPPHGVLSSEAGMRVEYSAWYARSTHCGVASPGLPRLGISSSSSSWSAASGDLSARGDPSPLDPESFNESCASRSSVTARAIPFSVMLPPTPPRFLCRCSHHCRDIWLRIFTASRGI